MTEHYDYKVFPETAKAKIALALAFAGGLFMILAPLLLPWGTDLPGRDPESACAPASYPDCLRAQDELAAQADDTCIGSANDICLVPLGRVSPELVRHLVEYYDEEYGLKVGVLRPTAIPEAMLNQRRNQVDALDLAELVQNEFWLDAQSRQTLLIGLTPVDIYIGTSDWRYAFGLRDPQPIISTCRMDPAAYGLPADTDLMFSRARKLVSKYIGLFYYGLPPNNDPRSPMFDNILSPADLDRMDEPLPIASF